MARIFYTIDNSPIRRSTDIDRHKLTKAQKKRLKRQRQAARRKSLEKKAATVGHES